MKKRALPVVIMSVFASILSILLTGCPRHHGPTNYQDIFKSWGKVVDVNGAFGIGGLNVARYDLQVDFGTHGSLLYNFNPQVTDNLGNLNFTSNNLNFGKTYEYTEEYCYDVCVAWDYDEYCADWDEYGYCIDWAYDEYCSYYTTECDVEFVTDYESFNVADVTDVKTSITWADGSNMITSFGIPTDPAKPFWLEGNTTLVRNDRFYTPYDANTMPPTFKMAQLDKKYANSQKAGARVRVNALPVKVAKSALSTSQRSALAKLKSYFAVKAGRLPAQK